MKTVTLNDLEQRNGRYLALFYRIRQRWRPIMSKWLKITQYCLQQKAMYDLWRYARRLPRTRGTPSSKATIWPLLCDNRKRAWNSVQVSSIH